MDCVGTDDPVRILWPLPLEGDGRVGRGVDGRPGLSNGHCMCVRVKQTRHSQIHGWIQVLQ